MHAKLEINLLRRRGCVKSIQFSSVQVLRGWDSKKTMKRIYIYIGYRYFFTQER